MKMQKFTPDNTHGYTQAQLDELNRRLEKTIVELHALRRPVDAEKLPEAFDTPAKLGGPKGPWD